MSKIMILIFIYNDHRSIDLRSLMMEAGGFVEILITV
jgi:hypothetical protein